MILEGNKSVFKAMAEKRRLMKEGKPHNHLKLLLIVDGGLMKGAYGIGAGMALHESGYAHVWDSMVGISSGAPTISYLLSDNVSAGSTILAEECCSKEFANFSLHNMKINFHYLIDVFRNHKDKKLNAKMVLESPTNVYYGVTDYFTAKPILIQPKTEDELFQALEASMSMPNVAKRSIHIDGKRYVDGGFARPHIISRAVSDIEATHILLITNQDKEVSAIPWYERLLNNTFFRFRMSYALRIAANVRRFSRIHALKTILTEKKTRLALVWGDKSISSLEQNGEKVKEVIEKSRMWWLSQLNNIN